MAEFTHSVVTPSAVKLIETADAKLHLRFDSDDEDANIDRMVASIQSEIESYLGRLLIDTEILQQYPGWGKLILLPFAPVISVESVKYYDTSNALKTIPPAKYEWINAGVSPVICEASGASWPSLYDRLAPVEITMKCGYGAAASDVPADIIDAAYLLLGDRFHNRGSGVEYNNVAMGLLAKHKNYT